MTDLFIGMENQIQKPEDLNPEKLEDLKREAKREYARKWRAKRREAEKNNPELAQKRKDKMKKWRSNNQDKVKAYSDRYWEAKALELMGLHSENVEGDIK